MLPPQPVSSFDSTNLRSRSVAGDENPDSVFLTVDRLIEPYLQSIALDEELGGVPAELIAVIRLLSQQLQLEGKRNKELERRVERLERGQKRGTG